MRMTSVRLAQVRKFRDVLTIDNFGAGLNVIGGPNEAGKSTIRAAISAAFLERYNARAPQQLLAPRDIPDARPTVTIGFEHGGEHYELTKQFYQRSGSCSLRYGSTVVSGDEAVARLAELFRFESPSSRLITDQQLGLTGIFWVAQGASLAIGSAMGHARSYVAAEIAKDVNREHETAANVLIKKLAEALGDVVTPGGRGGPLHAAERQRQECEQHVAEQKDRLKQVESLHKQLAHIEEQLNSLQHSDDERLLRGERADLHSQRDALGRAVREREQLEYRCKDIGERQEERAKQQADLKRKIDDHQAASVEVQARTDEFARLDALLAATNDELWGLRRRERELKDLTRLVDLQEERRELLERIEAIEADEERLKRDLSDAVARRAEIGEARAQLDQLPVGDGTEALRALEQECLQLRARLESVSTSVVIEVDQPDRLLVNGRVLAGSEHLFIDEEMIIEVAGVGRIVLTPQQSAASLRRDLAQREDDLTYRLATLGLDSVAALEARERERQEISQRIESAHRDLTRLLGPDESLEERLGSLTRHREELGLRLEANDQIRRELGEIDAVGRTEEELRAEIDNLHEALNDCELRFDNLQGDRQRCVEGRQYADGRLRGLEESIEQQGGRERLSELQRECDALDQQLIELTAELSAITSTIGDRDLASIEERIRQVDDSLESRRSRIEQLKQQREGVQGELRSSTVSEEELARAELELERASQQVASLFERKEALETLREIAGDIVAEIQEDLKAPLRERMNAYRAILFPEGMLDIDDEFRPVRLARSDDDEPVETLSWGTQEQLALMTRLGVADVMAKRGVPIVVMLDDALLNADALRLRGLKTMLMGAAERYQILIFTCHPELFADLGGAHHIDLGALSAQHR